MSDRWQRSRSPDDARHFSRHQRRPCRSPPGGSRRQHSRSPDSRGSSRHRDCRRDTHPSSSRHRDRSRDRHPSTSRHRDRSREERSRHTNSSGGQSSPVKPPSQQRQPEPQQEAKPLSRWERMELEEQEDDHQQQQQQQPQRRHGPDLKPSQQRPSQQQQQQGAQRTIMPSPVPTTKFNPEDSKALVLQMMQAPGGAASQPTAAASGAPTTSTAAAAAAAAASFSQQQQQQPGKQLWGAKRDAAAAGVTPAFGANRWDLAEFSNANEKLKFQRLLGAHKAAASAQPAAAAAGEGHLEAGAGLGPDSGGDAARGAGGPRVLRKDEQQRVLSDVERQFVAGLRRADGRTVGLGL